MLHPDNTLNAMRAASQASKLIGEFGVDGALKYVKHILLFPDVMVEEMEHGMGYDFWVRVKGQLELKQQQKDQVALH